MIMNLKEKFQKEVIPAMMEKFGYKNSMAVPRIKKVVVNTGFGREAVAKTGEEQKKMQESILSDLSLICGQKPVLTRSKKAISSFKLRKGLAIGAKVTLRRQKMYDFLTRLINLALPRSRDFQGIETNSIDREGNLTIAVKEHIAFPEVSPEKSKTNFGLEITVVTTAENKEGAENLFRMLGFPLKS